MLRPCSPEVLELLPQSVVRACAEVHRRLGPGLPGDVYVAALCQELVTAGVPHQRNVAVPVFYRGVRLGDAPRLSVCVDGRLAVQVRTVETLLPAHRLELRALLRITGLRAGLLVNFHATRLKHGFVLIRRAIDEDVPVLDGRPGLRLPPPLDA